MRKFMFLLNFTYVSTFISYLGHVFEYALEPGQNTAMVYSIIVLKYNRTILIL